MKQERESSGESEMQLKALCLDDDRDAADAMAEHLRQQGFEVTTAYRFDDALEVLKKSEFHLAVTDFHMGEADGADFCRRARILDPSLPVIVITGLPAVDTVVEVLRAGASDFLTKPVDRSLLDVAVHRAVSSNSLRREVQRLRTWAARGSALPGVVGESTPMQDVAEEIRRFAATDATVLITGESGTGKELAARAVHASSPRSQGPFVAINCAALPAALLESELFGHAKGAFTDAKTARRGLFLEASGGTLFLDEIGEMPLEMQAKLLRALQEHVVRPIGGNQEVSFDARIIAATNRDLEVEVNEKRFREDLFYRIHVCTVELPALRARGNDIALLAHYFTVRAAQKHKKDVVGISAEALQKLLSYRWPGNVRELENVVERSVAITEHDKLVVKDLPEKIRSPKEKDRHELFPESQSELVSAEEMELQYVQHVLHVLAGNKSRAARVLGYDRRTLYRKLDRLRDKKVRSGLPQDQDRSFHDESPDHQSDLRDSSRVYANSRDDDRGNSAGTDSSSDSSAGWSLRQPHSSQNLSAQSNASSTNTSPHNSGQHSSSGQSGSGQQGGSSSSSLRKQNVTPQSRPGGYSYGAGYTSTSQANIPVSGPQVVLLDPNNDTRELLALLLRSQGLSVFEAAHIDLVTVVGLEISAMVVDGSMWGAVKQSTLLSKTNRCVVLSGDDDLSVEGAHLLRKPVAIDQLVAALNR